MKKIFLIIVLNITFIKVHAQSTWELWCRENYTKGNTYSQSKSNWLEGMGKGLLQARYHKVPSLVFLNKYQNNNWLINSYPCSIQFHTNNIWSNNYYFKPSAVSKVVAKNTSSSENKNCFNSDTTILAEADVGGGTGLIKQVALFADSTKLAEGGTELYSFIWNTTSTGNDGFTVKAADSLNDTVVSSAINISEHPITTINATGTILREVWNDIVGTTVSDIPLSEAPGSIEELSVFQSPENEADNYGERIRGFVCAPVTGNYIFWISSDDNSELWLSSDDDPAKKIKIASVSGYTSSMEWTKYSTQQSASIYLKAGQKYYIEALHKEGTLGDNCAVGWQLPNGIFERPIPGNRLYQYVIPFTTTITSPADSSTFEADSSITIQATASAGTGAIKIVEFFADSTKLAEDSTSPYSFTWNKVSKGNYKLIAKATDSIDHIAVSTKVNVFVNQFATCSATGNILREVWNNVGGRSVSDIPLIIAPSSIEQLSVFQSPENEADNYGQRIMGYVCPPVTGSYIFWISSDDNSELWLSSNDNPANKIKIASVSGYTSSLQWTKYPSQQSVPKYLIAGQKYYIEALHKEASMGDNCAVGWQLPNGMQERPIPGFRLSPYVLPLTATITSPKNNSFFYADSTIVIEANVIGGIGAIKKVEFFSDSTKLGEDATSPYIFSWKNVVSGNYTLTVKVTDSVNNTALSSNVKIYVSPVTDYRNTCTISREVWNDISGKCVSAIPISTMPGSEVQLSIFQSPENVADNYGERIRGYVCPPFSGNYVFWISSDDNSELWLSSDDLAVNKIKIASISGCTSPMQWNKYSTQESALVYLTAGQKYYIEALHKEASLGDNCAVGWLLPNGVLERPIPGCRLSSYVPPLTATITSPANNFFFNAGSTITIQAITAGGTGTIKKAEFFADSTMLAEDLTSPYSFLWTNARIGKYALTVKVTDSLGDVLSSIINISVSPASTCNALGSITREVWNNIDGKSVSDIPLNQAPNSIGKLSVFQSPENVGDNYGQRIRGYVCPPVTGNYIFWIASDDESELWLSSIDDPTNKKKIASISGWTFPGEWTKYPTQQSVSKYLVVGHQYYIEALHKEGIQGDNCEVGWQLPNGDLERPIPGIRLSPFKISGNNPPIITITTPVDSANYASPTNITINAEVTPSGGSISKVEFYHDTTKIGEDLTAPYSFTWMNVITGNYALKAIATDNFTQTGTSQVINIAVNNCSTPEITPLGPTTMCSGSVALQSNTGTGFIYQWQKDGVNIIGATNSAYTAMVSGRYQIKIIQGSCISWSAPTVVKIQNGLSASITPGGPTNFCFGENVKLFANTCSGYSYQWKKDGSYIPGAKGAVYTATTAGNYQVQITKSGINVWSALVKVSVNTCRESEIMQNEEAGKVQAKQGFSDSLTTFKMKVFPNPNTGLFTIVINMSLIKDEKVKMKIVNVLGQEIYNKEYLIKDNYFKETVELDGSMPTGVYTLQVMIGNKVENTSVVLAR